MLLIAIGAALLLHHVRRGSGRDGLERMRATTELSYKRLKVDAASPEHTFDGRTAEVVQREDEVLYKDHVPSAVVLHIHARNPHGEYFYVVARSYDTPFVKHIPHASARAVLKDRYVAPGA